MTKNQTTLKKTNALASTLNEIEETLLPILVISNGLVTACNNSFAEEFGLKPLQVVGCPIEDRLSIPREQSSLVQLLSQASQEKSSLIFHATFSNQYHYPMPVKVHLRSLDESGIHYQLCFKITENRSIDPITNLPNGWAIRSQADYLMDLPSSPINNFVIVFFNVDNFSTINFRYGFDIGDDYLIALGQKLKQTIGIYGLVVRFNNAKFGILVKNQDNLPVNSFQSYIEHICQNLCAIADTPLAVSDNIQISKSFSIGVSERNTLYESYHAMEIAAETAMLQSSTHSVSKYCFSTVKTPGDILSRKLIIDEFPTAIEQSLFHVFYQPQYNLNDGSLIGFEALSRWNHPSLGNVAPDIFVGIAEDIGMHFEFDLWVITHVCRQIVTWQTAQFDLPKIAINLSYKTLEMSTFVDRLANILTQVGCPTSLIELEITETASVKNLKALNDNIIAVKKLGISIAVDDFGCGYSSLSLIKDFHQSLDKLKLDRSLIENICNTTIDRELTRQIIELSKVLNVQILAEGVEEEEQSKLLQQLGCHYAQGYLFAKPMDREQTEQLLQENTTSKQ